jgi:hypothetical protein
VGLSRHCKSGIYFSYGKESELGTGFLVQKEIVSGVKKVEFVSYGMKDTVLRGRWCNIIVLNAHAPNKVKSDDSKSVWGVIGAGFRSFS